MEILRIFKPCLAVIFIFPTFEHIEEIVFEANLQQLFVRYSENCKYI